MKKLFKVLLPFLAGALLISSCTDPTLIGSELLTEDRVNIEFTDTLSIKAKTVLADSVRTYSALTSEQINAYLYGNMKDPIMGTARSDIYLQLRPQFAKPDFTTATIDSVVLVLPYDTSNVYGSIAGTYDMELFQVTEELTRIDDHYSDTSFTFDPVPLASHEFTPSLDSLFVANYDGGIIDTVGFSHLRVPIDTTDRIKQLFFNQDTLFYEDDSTFIQSFKGLHLRANQETSGLLSFGLRATGSGIFVYYTIEGDSIPQQFRFELNDQSTRLTTFSKDYSGTIVESLLENPDLGGDSVVFTQSMAGLNIEVEVPNITELEGVIVNKAELELTIASLEDDQLSIFEPVQQLLVSSPNEEGTLAVIDDVLFSGTNLSSFFGGIPINNSDNVPTTYQINLSAHLQNMINGTKGTTFTISPFQTSQRGSRSIIYGSGHSMGMKLKVSYTKL